MLYPPRAGNPLGALPQKSEGGSTSAMPPDVWRGLPRRGVGGDMGLCPALPLG